jgi:hypothetical protein
MSTHEAFNNHHYTKLIALFKALNTLLPDAIIINDCTSLINEVAIAENEQPLIMELFYIVIETVCKIDYVRHHNKETYISTPLLFVSRDDIEISLAIMLLLG